MSPRPIPSAICPLRFLSKKHGFARPRILLNSFLTPRSDSISAGNLDEVIGAADVVQNREIGLKISSQHAFPMPLVRNALLGHHSVTLTEKVLRRIWLRTI